MVKVKDMTEGYIFSTLHALKFSFYQNSANNELYENYSLTSNYLYLDK